MWLLNRVRLSVILYVLLAAYGLLAFFGPKYKFEGAALTLFSVNSFLYGFYISPILSGQKSRVDELHKIARSEANAIFAIVLKSKKLPTKAHHHVMELYEKYIKAVISQRKPASGEKEYEEIITYLLKYKGDAEDIAAGLLDATVANETNRTNMNMQLRNKVYSNEWWIMLVLFSITLSFVALLDIGGNVFFHVIQAFLCTGLTMLLVILLKLSTLTHKKAKQIWDPYAKLLSSRFHQID